MTREEAINELKCAIDLTHFNSFTGESSEWLNKEDQRFVDACNMAIETLEEQNSVLDKIRDEISDNTYFINTLTEKEGIDFETVEKIIDKYKVQSEVKK